eukprot:TRINITY_DN7862_c0_g1_i2.p1 TRINITY_DN7862_c0_g1~~TRINITY_DN7862_c0_g1_i2.p1  ORF type:complete len:436 (+),score=51.39 TRINITY_DN7862_c0_g1_i2:36-1343(+)
MAAMRQVLVRAKTGFEFELSGENPACLSLVDQGGVAFRSGLRRGDAVIQLNGTNVVATPHPQIVDYLMSNKKRPIMFTVCTVTPHQLQLFRRDVIMAKTSGQPIPTAPPIAQSSPIRRARSPTKTLMLSKWQHKGRITSNNLISMALMDDLERTVSAETFNQAKPRVTSLLLEVDDDDEPEGTIPMPEIPDPPHSVAEPAAIPRATWLAETKTGVKDRLIRAARSMETAHDSVAVYSEMLDSGKSLASEETARLQKARHLLGLDQFAEYANHVSMEGAPASLSYLNASYALFAVFEGRPVYQSRGVIAPSHGTLAGKRLYLFYTIAHNAWVISTRLSEVKKALAVWQTDATDPVHADASWRGCQPDTDDLVLVEKLVVTKGGLKRRVSFSEVNETRRISVNGNAIVPVEETIPEKESEQESALSVMYGSDLSFTH